MNHDRLYDIMAGEDRSLPGRCARMGLSALEPGYRLTIWARNRLFDVGLRQPIRLPRATISVGNLTTGGTGKTPMVVELARRLIEQGSRPAVLLRGYMKDEGSAPSDEAVVLKNELGSSVPVEPDPNRAAAAGRVIEASPDVSVFLLDDAFQHRQVHRDVDLVLVDATRPLGFNRLLPRGLLREPAKTLRRADAVIVTRCDLVSPQNLAQVDQQITDLSGRPPAAHTRQRWTGFREMDTTFPPDYLQDLQVVGASAVGNPKAFEQMLQTSAKRVLHCHRYDDHHGYTAGQISQLLDDAKAGGADAVVTTEKDWVKWRPLIESRPPRRTPGQTPGLTPEQNPEQNLVVPILRPVLGVDWIDGKTAIDRLLDKTRRPGQ